MSTTTSTAADSSPTSASEKHVSVISPVYGCAGCLEELVERVSTCLVGMVASFEIILVDDGSPDHAWARIEEISRNYPVVRGVRLSRNFGQHHAIAAGIERAHGDYVIVMDCDLQDQPEEIPALLERALRGYDAVFARRIVRQDGPLKRLSSWGFHRVLSYMTDVPHDHTTANFGAFSRKAIDTVNGMPESDRCFPLMVRWTGLPMTSVDVTHAQRAGGESSYNIRRMIRLAINIILSYSDKPLRLVVKIGLLFAALSFVIVAWSIYRYVVGDIAVAGFTSIVASIWLLGGVMVSCVGIVGLYVGRIFGDVKRRPYYVIGEETSREAPP